MDTTLIGFVVGLALTALSVEVGRGRWQPDRLAPVVLVTDGLAVLLLPFALVSALDSGHTVDSGCVSDGPDASGGGVGRRPAGHPHLPLRRAGQAADRCPADRRPRPPLAATTGRPAGSSGE